jgi:hypothetical protein
VTPPALCLALYWYGLNTWFRDDDFLWLRLRFQVHNWGGLWQALFTPTAHGTFRPLSERAYFLVFSSLFPMEALPFRAWAFLTQFASLALLASITLRLTGSRLVGFLAPVFWTANSNLATALTWSSAYMQLLCGFFLLLAFHFLLRHIETGRWRYYWLQWGAFLAGFLAMETILVYPALAASYTLVCARRHFRRTLPLFAASLAFVVFHMRVAPKQAAGPYALHFDGALAGTLTTYWRWAWEPYNLAALTGYPGWAAPAGTALFSLALLGFTLWAVRRKHWLPLVFLAWFVILLAPVLPLRDHRSPYYLTLPAMALGMFAACAVAAAWRAGPVMKWVAAFGAACYLLISAPGAWCAAQWNYERSEAARRLVLGVARARQLHPREAILLTGVSDRLFWTAVWDGGFAAAGVSEVYLDERSQPNIAPRPGRADLASFFLPAEVAAQALSKGQLVVYDAAGPRLRNITRLYGETLGIPPGRAPRRVDLGNPLTGYLLGPTWYPHEGSHVWMPRRATVRVGGPRSPSERLFVSGYCPAFLLGPGPLEMTVSADGEVLGKAAVTQGDAHFRFDFGLPSRLAGRPEIEIEIRVNRTHSSPPEGRELGLVFGVFEVR